MSDDLEKYFDRRDQLRRELDDAKQTFGARIIDDEILFAAIKQALSSDLQIPDLPDFKSEPWRPASEDKNKQEIGLRLTESATQTEMNGVLTFSLGIYRYVSVGVMDFRAQEVKLSDKLKELGATQDTWNHFNNAYQEFLSRINMPSGDYTIDPLSGTFALRDDVERRMTQEQFEEFMRNQENT